MIPIGLAAGHLLGVLLGVGVGLVVFVLYRRAIPAER